MQYSNIADHPNNGTKIVFFDKKFSFSKCFSKKLFRTLIIIQINFRVDLYKVSGHKMRTHGVFGSKLVPNVFYIFPKKDYKRIFNSSEVSWRWRDKNVFRKQRKRLEKTDPKNILVKNLRYANQVILSNVLVKLKTTRKSQHIGLILGSCQREMFLP